MWDSLHASHLAKLSLELRAEGLVRNEPHRRLLLDSVQNDVDVRQRVAYELFGRDTGVEVVRPQIGDVVAALFARSLWVGKGSELSEVWYRFGV